MLCYSKSLSSWRLQVIAILGTYIINQKDNNLFLTTENSSKWFIYSLETQLHGKIFCSNIVPSYVSFNKTEYRKEHLERLLLAKVKSSSAASEEFKAQHQTRIQVDLNEETEIFWDPCAAEKCIKRRIWTHETYSDPVITGFTLQ